MRSTRLLSSSRRLLGLEPLPVPPHAFAVDAGHLRYGRFARHDGEFEFQEFHEVELPADAFLDGPLGGAPRDPERLRERLQALLDGITAPVEQASLVVPDAWLRLAFTEVDAPPRGAQGEEVLRWRLQKLVPFRVEELRIRGVEAVGLASGNGRHRLLVGYGLEQLLGPLEGVFASRGIDIGLLTNASLALTEALVWRAAAGERVAFALVQPNGYSLMFTRGGRPLFHRFKAAAAGVLDDELVVRDLRLTREFLVREAGELPPDGFLVVAPPAEEGGWLGRLERAFELPAQPLRASHLPLRGELPGPRLPDVAPLFGAASHTV